MDHTDIQDVLIIGGSYAGLSAAMALGRAMRKVLIVDSGRPCNRQTPHSHNFITRDGETPAVIAAIAKDQVLQYPTVSWQDGKAITAVKKDLYFEVETEAGAVYKSRKILFATGVTDVMPGIKGFAESWGISVLHCPYCHGYEVRHRKLGIIGNGDVGYHLASLIHNWSRDLAIFTDGPANFSPEQLAKIKSHNIEIREGELDTLEHKNGYLAAVVLKDGNRYVKDALFARIPFVQHCTLPLALGCATDEQGYIKTDEFKKTSVAGVYAAGDNTTMMRAVSNAVAAGALAGSMINKELIDEDF